MATVETNHLESAQPAVKRRWTYDELLAEMPETNQPSELWDGELIMSPVPHPLHQTIVGTVYRMLYEFVAARNLGEVYISPIDIVLSPTRVVQPDVVYISKSNFGIVTDRIRGVPDLAVEVISQGSWRRDRVDKKALYEQFGVTEYWIVDIEARTIEVFARVRNAYQLHGRAAGAKVAKSKLLTGFGVSFAQLETRRAS